MRNVRSSRSWTQTLLLAPMAVAAGLLLGVVGVSLLWSMGAVLTGYGTGAVMALSVIPYAVVVGLPIALLYGLPVYVVLLRYGCDRRWLVTLIGLAIPVMMGVIVDMGVFTLLMSAYGAGAAYASHVVQSGFERAMDAGPPLRPPG